MWAGVNDQPSVQPKTDVSIVRKSHSGGGSETGQQSGNALAHVTHDGHSKRCAKKFKT